MEFTFPNYYKEFSCIAGSCPDWQIQEEVEEVTAERKEYLDSKKKEK